jgi:ferredoxin
MTHVVTDNCILCKNTECVDVCPVDCFKEATLMLVIDPYECIDCGVCVSACPTEAIFADDDVPDDQQEMIAINYKLSRNAPVINQPKARLPDASVWRAVPGKAGFIDSEFDSAIQYKDNKAYEKYKYLATSEELLPNEWESALEDNDPISRYLVASRKDYVIDRPRLNRGLADTSDRIRKLFISKCSEELTESDIDNTLNDPSVSVRVELINKKFSVFNPRQIERALIDPEAAVRLSVITSSSFRPTRKQFFRSLESSINEEVRAILQLINPKVAPLLLNNTSATARAAAFGFEGILLSKEQIDSGLNDKNELVRFAVLRRSDFQLSGQQLVSLVAGGDLALIKSAVWKANEDCIDEAIKTSDQTIADQIINFVRTLSQSKIREYLSDPRDYINLAIIRRLGPKLSQGQISLCLKSSSIDVRLASVTTYGVNRLTARQIDLCLADPSEKIRRLAIESKHQLSEVQLEKALTDRSAQIRMAAAGRKGFLPSEQQYKRGIADKSKSVSELFSTRFGVLEGKVIDVSESKPIAQPEFEEELAKVLLEISGIETWTRRKYELKDELLSLLEQLEYLFFSVSARQAWFSQFGEHSMIEVPPTKRGHLQPMRGQKIHLVCLGHGRYTTINFAAKPLRLIVS